MKHAFNDAAAILLLVVTADSALAQVVSYEATFPALPPDVTDLTFQTPPTLRVTDGLEESVL